jgi:hypothetical protein
MKESAERESGKSEAASQSKRDVNANGGSTAVGSLNIGGSVNGNIVIGDNNQVNNK